MTTPPSPESIELGRTVELKPDRTAHDYIRCLTDFLAIADQSRGQLVGIQYDQRFSPLKIKSDLLLYPANRVIIREIRQAYHNPAESVASDKLKRFFDLVLDQRDNLPQIANDNNRPVSWFYQRRRGYWATILGNLIANDGGVGGGVGQWTSPLPSPPSSFAFTGNGVPGLYGIPPERLHTFRNLLQVCSIFGVDHNLTKEIIKYLLRDIEYSNGRHREGAAPPPPPHIPFTLPPPSRCSTRR